MKSISITISFLILCSPAFAVSKPKRLGSASVTLLEKEIGLEPGYGTGKYFPGTEELPKQLVNQGFAMMNLFQYTDAFRSFATALKLDSTLRIANIGRGFAALQLAPKNRYYTDIATADLIAIKPQDQATQAWGDLLSSLVTSSGLDGRPLTPARAYKKLKTAAPDNLEVPVFANWFSKVRSIPDFQTVLESDPQSAGALHFLLHISEDRHDHERARALGEQLIAIATHSAHAQHMYGHVLPHFNRWYEADKQFTIADQLHRDWAKKNKAHPAEDWHYMHNLDLWAVTKMVIAPQQAQDILWQILQLNKMGILDYLDYTTAYLDPSTIEDFNKFLTGLEDSSPRFKKDLLSSRLYFDLVTAPGEATFTKINEKLASQENFKNRKLILQWRDLILLHGEEAKASKYKAAEERILEDLAAQFKSGGFDGWTSAALHAIKLKRLLLQSGLVDTNNALDEQIFGVYMSPVDQPNEEE